VRNTALVHLSRARQEIQTARTFEDVRIGLNKAEQLRLLAQQVDASVELKNEVTELLLRWQRRAGEMLKEGGDKRDRAVRGQAQIEKSHDVTFKPPTLSEIGISKMESSRWQAVASVPEEDFEQVIQETKDAREELTQASILRVAKEQKSEERREERIAKVINPLNTIGRFPLIYADPPWRYDFSRDDADQVENHYPTMTVDEICELEVSQSATEDAILFMWTTSPKLEESFAVIDAWGFRYRTCAIWDKQWIGPGYYFRQRHELLLVATKGNLPVPLPSNRPDSVFTERRTAHSKKPKIAYQLIERMYPELPKLELFARSAREGWTVWGNEVTNET
jgi:N6-adenosine-specific RNA methylase IME4